MRLNKYAVLCCGWIAVIAASCVDINFGFVAGIGMFILTDKYLGE